MTSRVVVSLRVPATPLRAFEAFTQEIGQWWVYNPFFKLTPRSPGVMSFEAPNASGEGGRLVETLASGKVYEVGKVRHWAPGEKLVVGWRIATFGPEHDTEVEVRFEPVGDEANETRVTVEHRGWESVPEAHVARHRLPLTPFLERLGQYWREMLGRLAATPEENGS